jgi:hypothetical protein
MKHGSITATAPVDLRGRRVPTRLAAPFVARARLVEMARTVSGFRDQLTGTSYLEELLGKEAASELRDQCKALEAALVDAAPAMPCKCARDKECPNCMGRGWLTTKQIRVLLSL